MKIIVEITKWLRYNEDVLKGEGKANEPRGPGGQRFKMKRMTGGIRHEKSTFFSTGCGHGAGRNCYCLRC